MVFMMACGLAAASHHGVVWTAYNLSAPTHVSKTPPKNHIKANITSRQPATRNITLLREQLGEKKPAVVPHRVEVPVHSEACNAAFPAGCYPNVTLPTAWTAAVNPAAPLPEYPRPMLVRGGAWMNLNGVWEFAQYLYAVTVLGNADPLPPILSNHKLLSSHMYVHSF